MALIHEKLYRSDNLAQIDIADYIQELVADLFRAQNAARRGIILRLHSASVLLDIEKAVPCGLIVNELVSNALKHAFPNGRSGEVWIELKTDDQNHVTLIVADNGIGFPAELDFREAESLGLRLVDTLVNQLDGTLELDSNQGTRFILALSSPN
jgi:two-component sensor histidine kinase